ncbi:PKD domain-containing protein [Halorientalis salina]|uniref:PKD domain-containing protein n=1 Tax=Halorientalis salina TaxID=2932266 RepID=UPI00145F1FC6|nr:PKD domain-containing protein [Halorientalis salina]
MVVVLSTGAPGVGLAGEPPLADAGLDQQTTVGATVQLDATGSRDPDGSITAYNWTIEAPNGSTLEPSCGSCGTTTFRPTRIGQYNVTVSVTGEDGLNQSDTLYVEANAGTGPSVQLSGTENPTVGSDTTYTADASAGNVPLERVEWHENDSEVGSQAIGGDQQAVDHEFTFANATPRNVTATVIDVAGQRTNESLVVRPQARRSGGGDHRQGFYRSGVDGGEYVEAAPSVDKEGYNTVIDENTGEVEGTVECCYEGDNGDSPYSVDESDEESDKGSDDSDSVKDGGESGNTGGL